MIPDPGMPPPRRVRALMVSATLVAAAVAAVAAGIALATTRPPAIGSGVVVIDTDLAYRGGSAAGTGMVLTSDGEVLTNNHVIRDSTSIRIVLPGTGRSYRAKVVGYDAADDVAVLQASGAAHLRTISVGDSSSLATGQPVRALGNAGGTGRLRSASGTVTAVHRAITVGDDQGGSEHLTGMIETDAPIRPGDSGGPLMDAAGRVVGMDTAASVRGGLAQSATGDGFAIPIARAVSIAERIAQGNASATIHVGGTAFLGVEVTDSAAGAGAAIVSVFPGGPAAAAGLAPGDLVTSVGGRVVSSPDGLTAAVAAQRPGARVPVTYADQSGASHTATVTLGSGPAH